MKHNISFWILLMVLLLCVVPASAQVLEDNFTAAAGTLLTDAGWTASSGTTNYLTIASPGLSFTGYGPSGVGNALPMANSGQDVYKTFAPVTSDSVYVAFMANFSAVQATGDYFVALSTSAAPSFYLAGRLFVKTSGGGFVVGISKSNETVTYGTTVFSLNTTYLFVVKYAIVPNTSASDTLNDQLSVFVVPSGTSLSTETTPEIAKYTTSLKGDPANVGAISVRQGNASNAPTLTIDGIRVAKTWNALVSPWYKVTFKMNTATSQDTIRPGSAVVQIRGNTAPLTWDGGSLNMTNVAGDYWTANALFISGTALQVQYFVNDWEGVGNTELTVLNDTIMPMHYYKNGLNPPYRVSDSIDVWFRVNMGSRTDFDPAADQVAVRGGFPWSSGWDVPMMLTREGTTKFYSGAIRYDQTAKGTNHGYKFVFIKGTSTTWEDAISDRNIPVNNDTTLGWQTFENKPIVTVVPDSINVTFLINTSTIPDTLLSTSTVQLRGSMAPLSWDNGTGVKAVNIGGDYWRANATFLVAPGSALDVKYKIFTNNKAVTTGDDVGWENNTTDGSTNRVLYMNHPTAGKVDTTIMLQYANGSPSNQDQYWRPYVPQTDSVAVLFRINMQSQETFNKATTRLGLRGAFPPAYDWQTTIFLTQEKNHGNTGQSPYDGTNFWSGVVMFPKTKAAGTVGYKFVQLAVTDVAGTSPTWENDPNRSFEFNPAMADTTLYWKWWNNQIMMPFSGADTVIMTFRLDLSKAISENGAVATDTIVVRSGYNSSATSVREKRLLRVGISSKFQAIDTVITKSGTSLYYQYYRTPASGEVREIYYNFANPGSSATAEKRRFQVPASANNTAQMIQDTINSTSAEHRMPKFRNMKTLSQAMVVTYTCDVRPAIYQIKAGSQLVATNITNWVMSNVDSVILGGVWMNGPAVGGWDIGGSWGSGRRALDTAKMYDDGTHGDLVAHDSIFSLQYSYTTSVTVGQEFKFGLYGCDNEGGFGNNHIENINDANPTATIASQFGSIDPNFYSAWNYTTSTPNVGVDGRNDNIPLVYNLDQNYPNPFNPSTRIDYELQSAGHVSLKVFNLLGQVVASLANEKQEAGRHYVAFDASRLSSGIYFYQINSGNFTATKKMILMK
jgi:hypothetical protein